MAKKATSIARELKSVKSDLSFLQERCSLLEEENRRLRDGFTKGIRPEEDDLVYLGFHSICLVHIYEILIWNNNVFISAHFRRFWPYRKLINIFVEIKLRPFCICFCR